MLLCICSYLVLFFVVVLQMLTFLSSTSTNVIIIIIFLVVIKHYISSPFLICIDVNFYGVEFTIVRRHWIKLEDC